MYISETTASERLTIQNAIDPLICNVECSARLLDRLLQRYFTADPQQSIPDYEAEHLADALGMIHSALFDAVLEYHLTVGQEHPAAAMHLEGAEQARKAQKVSELLRASTAAQQRQLCALPDDEIIEKLTCKGE